MYDGAVVFDTRLNNKQLERDYSKAVNKIRELEGDLNAKTAKRSGLVKQADEFAAKLDVAKARLYEMQTAGRGVFTSEQITSQRENVAALQADWDRIQRSIESCDKQIGSATEKLDAQKDKAARLSSELQEAAVAQSGLEDAAGMAVVKMEKLTSRISKLASRALVFSVITMGLRLMRDWLGEVVTKNDQTSAAIARLKGALLTLAQPLLTVIIPVFTALVNLLTAVIGKIASFLSMLGGKTVKESAAAADALENQKKAYSGVGAAAKEAKKQLMGFDELNRLEDTTTSGGGGGGGGTDSGKIAPDFGWSENVTATMEKLAGWVLAIAAGFALWKISSYSPGTLGAILGTIGKILAGVGLVAVGFILLKDAFQDASENGMNLNNTLMMIAGIIATGLGITLLTGSLIPLLVAGILSLLTAIAYMTGNGGALIDSLKQMFGGLGDFVMGIFTGDWSRAMDGLIVTAHGVYNVIAAIINSLMDMVAAGINMISFDVPSWVPVIGGSHVGFNVVAPNIPYLAEGAVIPPNRKFLAVLGDQRNGTNVEAPLDTIKQALSEVMAEYGGGDIQINFTGDLAQLARILYPEIHRQDRNTARARGW